MSSTAEEIIEEFLEFDIHVNDEILGKLLEITALFSLEPDDLLNEWIAYQSRNEQPTLSFSELERFEQDLSNSKNKTVTAKSNLNDNEFTSNVEKADNIGSIIGGYCSPANKSKLDRLSVTTPVRLSKSKEIDFLSPSVFSPLNSNSSSQKYSTRSNSGEVISSFSESDNFEFSYDLNSSKSCKIVSLNAQPNYKYMFQKMIDLCDILNDAVEEFADKIMQQHESEINSFAPCSAPCQGEVSVVGRIRSENSSRLSPNGVVLEGDRTHSFGRNVNLELSNLNEYSIFPGQIVAICGTNPSGKKLVANKLFTPKLVPGKVVAAEPVAFINNNLSKTSIIIASGPFTTSDTLTYEPLMDLINIVKKNTPNMTVLIGPLIDANHKEVQSNSLSESFSELSSKYIKTIRSELETYTQVVFIPSVFDVFHHPVYPQPPYFKRSTESSHFMPNPCLFHANDIHIAATSADILFHLGAEEISRSSGSGSSDRLTRLIHHLLAQQSFYPLYPSHESVPLDIPAAEFRCKLDPDLDILILPSDLRCFAKCVEGRLCINPGRLAKGLSGGTYARVLIDSERKAVAQLVRI